MTEQPPAAEPHRERHPPEPAALPPWVPVLIGAVLVVMAAFAVYTGIRYRNPALANRLIHRRTTPHNANGGGAPGEPEPGGSLVFPGASADAVEPIAEGNRVQIGGGKEGVSATVRMSARRGLITNVLPEDAMIYVNGLAIGQAKQFNTPDEVYDFPSPGAYTVRIVAPDYRERVFLITADDSANLEIARLDVKLERQ